MFGENPTSTQLPAKGDKNKRMGGGGGGGGVGFKGFD